MDTLQHIMRRECHKCGQEKCIERFPKSKSCKGGRGWISNICMNITSKKRNGRILMNEHIYEWSKEDIEYITKWYYSK